MFEISRVDYFFPSVAAALFVVFPSLSSFCDNVQTGRHCLRQNSCVKRIRK